jgi:hypothetical protein
VQKKKRGWWPRLYFCAYFQNIKLDGAERTGSAEYSVCDFRELKSIGWFLGIDRVREIDGFRMQKQIPHRRSAPVRNDKVGW